MSGTPIRVAAGAEGADESASPALGQLDRAGQIAELRSRMSALGGEVARPVAETVDVVRLGEELRMLFPGGGLPRRSVSTCSDTPALIVEILDEVTGSGGFAGVVGWPELSYAGIAPENLDRVVAVPDPGLDPLSVAGVLSEGLDLVVLRSPQRIDLSPVRARPLLAKLRKGNAALVSVGTRVPSPALEVTGEVAGIHGIGRGTGRIRGIDIRVRVEAKGARAASRVVTLGAAPNQAKPSLRVVG
ncbi:hypothetical protein [Corynebacterium sp.]|uniref:hypothetical protein n=1 Tax=Corynebacterium sp. TaxID=1720 RepID=UPI002A90E32A|nr:hypothetical protein [Corynebacterium sp.]MDY5785925.1 hypothetical protein [Corynebacterium sp.]